jgi:hypothetical protein
VANLWLTGVSSQRRISGKSLSRFGGRSRTRTYDPLIKSQLLYHLSYAPVIENFFYRAIKESIADQDRNKVISNKGK